MKQIAETNNYELMIVISSKYTENEIKNIAFNYAEQLQKLGAISINVVSRGRHNLSYKKKKIEMVISLKYTFILLHNYYLTIEQN